MTALLPFPNPNSIPHSALNTPHSLGSALAPRRTGKVARLPKATRDRINRLLDENVPYHSIIADLGEAGKDLNPQNISNWAQGGYQDYLRHQDMLDLFKDQLEFATDLLAQVPDPSTIFQALRLMAGLQLSRVLFETGQKLAETDPAAYARLVRTICSLSSAERQFCQSRNPQAQVPSAPAKPIDYTRPLTERETHCIQAKLNQMFGYPDEPVPAIKPNQASTHPVGTSSTSSPTMPADAASSPIKADQISAPPVGTDSTPSQTISAIADAQSLEFKVQGSTFEVQGSPAQPELPPAQSAANPIKPDQTSAHPVGTSSTSSPTMSANAASSSLKPDQASSGVKASVPAAGEGGFQPLVPVLLGSSPIKVDQACTDSAIVPFTSAGPDV